MSQHESSQVPTLVDAIARVYIYDAATTPTITLLLLLLLTSGEVELAIAASRWPPTKRQRLSHANVTKIYWSKPCTSLATLIQKPSRRFPVDTPDSDIGSGPLSPASPAPQQQPSRPACQITISISMIGHLKTWNDPVLSL